MVTTKQTEAVALKPLGGQGLPMRHVEARELARALDGGFVDYATVKPVAGRGDATTNPYYAPYQGKTASVRDALPIPLTYRLVSMVVNGKLSAVAARQLAERERAMPARLRLPRGWAEAALEIVQARGQPAKLPDNAHPYTVARANIEAQVRASFMPQTLDAVAAELVLLGCGAGPLYSHTFSSIDHYLTGIPLPEGRARWRARVAELGGPLPEPIAGYHSRVGYAETLLRRAGVPLTAGDYSALSPEQRAAWSRDASMVLDPSKDARIDAVPEAIAEVEAQLDAELR